MTYLAIATIAVILTAWAYERMLHTDPRCIGDLEPLEPIEVDEMAWVTDEVCVRIIEALEAVAEADIAAWEKELSA